MPSSTEELKIAEGFLSQLKSCCDIDSKDFIQIKKALELATTSHTGQIRKYEGIPYLTHPTSVAMDLAVRYKDPELIIAALLHDVVEDSEDVDHQDIYEKFGQGVGFLVDAVSKHPLHYYQTPELIYQDKIEKILAGGMQDPRVLLLKIADRDHNLQTLKGLKPAKQIRMTFETQAIYEPLKELLGIERKDLTSVSIALHNYIKTFEITSPQSFKKHLFNQMYHNFDDNTYHLVYKNTDSVVREIEDNERFEELLKNKKFEQNVTIVSMETDGVYSKVRFFFKKGYLLSKKEGKKVKIYNLKKE